MRKFFWLGIGVTVGVLAARKVAAAKGAIGPEGLSRALGRFGDGLHDFADAVRSGMGERESDLRAALGLEADRPVGARRAARH